MRPTGLAPAISGWQTRVFALSSQPQKCSSRGGAYQKSQRCDAGELDKTPDTSTDDIAGLGMLLTSATHLYLGACVFQASPSSSIYQNSLSKWKVSSADFTEIHAFHAIHVVHGDSRVAIEHDVIAPNFLCVFERILLPLLLCVAQTIWRFETRFFGLEP
jgi:hypothetical protein